MVISSPSTYRDVQQELIAEIHRTAIWPVVVTVDGNISKTTETDFTDRDGSYIILITDGNFKSFKDGIIGLPDGKEHSFTIFWNSDFGFLWLEQMNSQCRNRRIYLIISQKIENIIALS